jgi:DNA-directed RNA polymerase subunit N (RpoN/RPB10)
MAKDLSEDWTDQTGSQTDETDAGVVSAEQRVCCRRCQSAVLTLSLCGPHLRGRCVDCGTVWMARWSDLQRARAKPRSNSLI